jgi:polysaccharide biosynthesis protein PslG
MDSQGRRRVRRTLAVLALGMVAAAAVVVARLPIDSPAPASAQTTDGLIAGVQMHPFWDGVTPYDWNDELRIARNSKAKVVRIDLAWSSLQLKGRGRFDRSYAARVSHFLSKARAYNVGVIASFIETPCWASRAPRSLRQGCRGAWWNRGVTRYPPRRAGDYADAAAYVAQRWGSHLMALEIWNEPNAPVFLRSKDPVRDYARLVRVSYGPIKKAAPNLTVLAGALALSDGDFLSGLFDRGRIAGRYDAISYHPYTNGTDPSTTDDPRGAKWSFPAGSAWLHDIMANHGDPNPQLWATEAGASTCDTGVDSACVSEDKQAKLVSDYFEVARTIPYLRALVIYSLRDSGLDRRDREQNFGLIRLGLSPKPGLSAFRRAASP